MKDYSILIFSYNRPSHLKRVLIAIEDCKISSDINLIIEIADKHFALQNYDDCMNLLLDNYPKNKDKIKEKMIEFFGILGNSNEITIIYRKKLSQIMFS